MAVMLSRESKINLAFNVRASKRIKKDLREIASRIEARASDISVKLFSDTPKDLRFSRRLRLAFRPTLSIEMWPIENFQPFRGDRLTELRFPSKVDELLHLAACGVAVPRWAELRPDSTFDATEWGAYVVEKPSLGSKGHGVRIRKTGRVRYRRPEEYDQDHPGRSGTMLIQKFVYTGPWPVSYRVLTYFGEPIICYRHERKGQPEINSFGDFRKSSGLSIVATAVGCTMSLSQDSEIIELARHVHRTAFERVPLLGQDIIREWGSGKLYLLETNPSGAAWPFGKSTEPLFAAPAYEQFGLFDVVAAKSIEVARQYAR